MTIIMQGKEVTRQEFLKKFKQTFEVKKMAKAYKEKWWLKMRDMQINGTNYRFVKYRKRYDFKIKGSKDRYRPITKFSKKERKIIRALFK